MVVLSFPLLAFWVADVLPDDPNGEPITKKHSTIDTLVTDRFRPCKQLDYLAVTAFTARGVDSSDVAGFSYNFSAHLSKNCVLPLLEPEEIEVILGENEFSAPYLCDHNDCFIEIGRYLGVKYIIAGSIGKVKDILTFVIRMIDVTTEEVELFLLHDYQMSYYAILEKAIPELAEECNEKIARLLFATAQIASQPDGALVFIDDKYVGATPLLLKNRESGVCRIHLSKKTFQDVRDTLFLKKGKLATLNYTLKPTDAFQKQLREQQRSVNIRILQGTGLVVSLGAFTVGGYYEKRCNDALARQQEIMDDYNSTGSTDFSPYKERYDEQSEKLDQRRKYRNIGFITGIVLAAGVSVTLFF